MASLRSPLSLARLLAGWVSPRSRTGCGWDDALALVRSGACAGVSVDCFDTLLARTTPDWEQQALAAMAGVAAGRDGDKARRMLVIARRRARRRGGPDGEPGAAVIWEEFCAALDMPLHLAARLCAHEFSLLEMSTSAPAMALDFIAAVGEQRLPWVVCSDTRWPRAELSRLLSLKGFAVGQDAVFCSCDHGKNKFRGGLYAIAHGHLRAVLGPGLSRADIIHVGDNFFSDACSAACFGMRSVRIPPAPRQPGEAALAPHLEAMRHDIAGLLK